MKPGIYKSITNNDYHKGPGVSKSGLDLINRSPLHYLAATTAEHDREATASQALGTAFHALLLEPNEFIKQYCLALRQSDVPHAIAEKDQLLAMVGELNAVRLPKLPTGGSKQELIARLCDAVPSYNKDEAEKATAAELKAHIDALNIVRPGLLSATGTMDQLAQLLRENGRQITLWTEVKAEWAANNGHRIVLSQDQWTQLHSMRDAVMAHPAANALMTGAPGVAEWSVYWNDPMTGELCRCRPDFWRRDGIIVDVKTTQDASPEGFARSIANWRYHVQHALYLDGIGHALQQARKASRPTQAPHAFVFLAVETNAQVVNGQAKGVGVYVLDAGSVELGRAQYRANLDSFHGCRQSGKWPGYGDNIQPISLPSWEFTKNAHLLGAA